LISTGNGASVLKTPVADWSVHVPELLGQPAGRQRDRFVDVDDPVVRDPGVGVVLPFVHMIESPGVLCRQLHHHENL
jgi:hypothetical protein